MKMKMPIKLSGFYILLFSIIFLNVRCADDCEGCISQCLNDVIENIKQSHCSENASISKYRFQHQIVFFIDPGNCVNDQSYDVIDSNCLLVGNLGGFAGHSKINGDDFYEKAKFIEVIWHL
jgi:NAD-dependent dihydropyrimidine dehydrogenase PreA subunit